MVGLQLACRYKLEFPSRRKVKMLVDGGECAMKNGEPITKSILIADLPAGDKPWSCRPTMPAVCRLSVHVTMLRLLYSLLGLLDVQI